MRLRSMMPATMALAALAVGCGRSESTRVSIVGSTSIHPFAEMLAEEFHARDPGVYVEVQGGGSTAGVLALTSGIAEIATCSRCLHPDEPGLTSIAIAQDGVALVVHRSNPVEGLTRAQLRDLFAGKVTNWREVGGLDQPVRLIAREEGSGTREAFLGAVMGDTRLSPYALTQESSGAVKEVVRHDPCAIGFMSLSLVGRELKALAVDGVRPTAATVSGGTYPLVRPFLFVVRGRPSEAARRFIDFVLSPAAHELLEKARGSSAEDEPQRGTTG